MRWLSAWLLALVCVTSTAYPLDAFEDTGIRRLEYYRQIVTGELQRKPLPVGARLPRAAVGPRLAAHTSEVSYDTPDNSLGRAIARALGNKAPHYAVSVLDLSDPDKPVYGEHNAHIRRNFGSVGKMLVAVSWFQVLADVLPDIERRERLMRDTWITADAFIKSDHHKVIIYDSETGQRAFRKIREGDRATLWEWTDWMLSASNNSAAATMQKQLVLLHAFGADYPPTPEQEAAFFDDTPRSALGERFLSLMTEPNARNGVDSELLRQGSVFTREGKRRLPGTSSYGNTREIVKLLHRLERGEVVDTWSSRELKRLLYMTQRRIRYASHPALDDYAVYYKSGSLYRCKEEPGFVCREYAGNDYNLLASVAIVEGPVRNPKYHYLVAVSSNVLRENSAVAHQTLALRIHRLLEERHRSPQPDNASGDEPLESTHPSAHPSLQFEDIVLIGERPPEEAPVPSDTDQID